MPVSQFKYYSASDAGAPVLAGTVGSLLAVLNGCLVTGYGTRVAAGWTKPIADSGNCGHFLQGAGSSGHYLYINDNGPNVTSTYKEAWITGWKAMSAITAPVGVGNGQFPNPGQMLTTGHLVLLKSDAASSSSRDWFMYADASTFYLFTRPLVNDTRITFAHFGDFYSLAGSADEGRCMINGRTIENNSSTFANTPYDTTDQQTSGGYTSVGYSGTQNKSQWASGSAGAALGSVGVKFSSAWSNWYIGTYNYEITFPLAGLMATPNPVDGAFYIAPVRIHDMPGPDIRGRLRGVWATGHLPGSFHEGQIITGANDTAGKTFRVVKTIGGSVLLIETSNTVETN